MLPGYNNVECKPVSASVNHDGRHVSYGLVQSELDYSGWIKTRSEYARACGPSISFALSDSRSFSV
ncbi:hypothetical protein ALC60_02149 [Trachymyrmex zeteki]|uniref:Uncharacterized protein n=1 Tax=Mycetomoellerius zeteki TaxID=64791 RepID=A0A151XEL6_9HYME|nr:hypothetical protein ALC60_02149 [Trachymyrmex zeteki]